MHPKFSDLKMSKKLFDNSGEKNVQEKIKRGNEKKI